MQSKHLLLGSAEAEHFIDMHNKITASLLSTLVIPAMLSCTCKTCPQSQSLTATKNLVGFCFPYILLNPSMPSLCKGNMCPGRYSNSLTSVDFGSNLNFAKFLEPISSFNISLCLGLSPQLVSVVLCSL